MRLASVVFVFSISALGNSLWSQTAPTTRAAAGAPSEAELRVQAEGKKLGGTFSVPVPASTMRAALMETQAAREGNKDGVFAGVTGVNVFAGHGTMHVGLPFDPKKNPQFGVRPLELKGDDIDSSLLTRSNETEALLVKAGMTKEVLASFYKLPGRPPIFSDEASKKLTELYAAYDPLPAGAAKETALAPLSKALSDAGKEYYELETARIAARKAKFEPGQYEEFRKLARVVLDTKAAEAAARRKAELESLNARREATLTEEEKRVKAEVVKLGGTLSKGSDYIPTTNPALTRPAGSSYVSISFDRAKAAAVGDDFLTQLANLSDLTTLDLSFTAVTDTGIKSLNLGAKGLARIEILKLEGTSITDASLANVKESKSLTWLHVSRTKITDAGFDSLKGMPLLTAIHASATQVSDAGLAAIAGMTKMERLVLAETSVSDAGLASLAAMDKLATLDLKATRVTDAGLGKLASLKSLNFLVLAGTKISDAGLEKLKASKSITKLAFGGTAITDAGLAHLKAMTQLVEIDLTDTKATEAGVKALQAALPKCVIKNSVGVATQKAN